MSTLGSRSRTRPAELIAGPGEPVIVVGAGPVGCTAALLLAERGIPVTVLERRPERSLLPRAVHLDDEVVRILGRVGILEAFLHHSRAAAGLRLLDADHRVMAELPREPISALSGLPPANMFHQPELEGLLLDRIHGHPLVTLHRGIEVVGLEQGRGGVAEPSAPARLEAKREGDDEPQIFTGRFVLGCDGANSAIRELLGISMQDLKFTERWLVVDVHTDRELDSWGGVDQVCDPDRAATFMRVVDNQYRWEFQLHDDEDEADLLHPHAFGRLLSPWTGRSDLEGLDIGRSATYTFRARLARRFRLGQVFLLGDAAHTTPPFIGQGLGAGLRDADNLAWKLADVLTGSAAPDLLDTYETERRPHARALIQKALVVGWCMTGGQDRAAFVRRLAIAAAVKSPRICALLAATETPRLRTGAIDQPGRLRRLTPSVRSLRIGGLIPNLAVRTVGGSNVRLDDLLDGRPAMLTSRRPETQLLDLCGRLGIQLIRLQAGATAPGEGYTGVVLAGPAGRLQQLLDDERTVLLVRPDRVVAAVARGSLPRIPWDARPPAHAAAERGAG